MRLFAAIAFDPEIKIKISQIYEKLRAIGVVGSFTQLSNLHLTLKFFGEENSQSLQKIKFALDKAAANTAAFDITADKCGSFSTRGGKIIWLGMAGKMLYPLYTEMEKSLSEAGFIPEMRAFTPHITLVRKAQCDEKILSEIEIEDLTIYVDKITLFESKRENGFLRYKPLHVSKLSLL